MKKLALILVIAFAAIISSYEAKATPPWPPCPAPYTSQMNQVIIVNGCTYDVEICFKCEATGPGIIDIFGFSEQMPGCQTWDINTVYNSIAQQVFALSNIQNLCSNSVYKPCDEYNPNEFDYTLAYHVCWHKATYLDNNVVRRVYIPCQNPSDVYCYELWKICWDPSILGVVPKFVTRQITGSIWCTDDEPINDPTPGNPPGNLGSFSSCFHLHTPCNP